MDKIRIKKYKSAVYTSLLFASVVLGFLGNYIFTQETLKAIVINLASELLAVGILFFIVDLIFSIGEDNNSVFDEIATIKEEIATQQGLTIKAQSERLDRAFDLVIKEIEKIKGSSEEYAKILKAIRDVSKYSDEIKERIEINAERERLESERDSLKEQLKESQTALREKTREANRKGEELAQRRQELIQKNNEIVQKDKEIAEKNDNLKRKDDEMYKKDQEIKQMNEKLTSIENRLNSLKFTLDTNFDHMNNRISTVSGLNSHSELSLEFRDFRNNVIPQLESITKQIGSSRNPNS